MVLLKFQTLKLKVGPQGWGSLEMFSGENIVVLELGWVQCFAFHGYCPLPAWGTDAWRGCQFGCMLVAEGLGRLRTLSSVLSGSAHRPGVATKHLCRARGFGHVAEIRRASALGTD